MVKSFGFRRRIGKPGRSCANRPGKKQLSFVTAAFDESFNPCHTVAFVNTESLCFRFESGGFYYPKYGERIVGESTRKKQECLSGAFSFFALPLQCRPVVLEYCPMYCIRSSPWPFKSDFRRSGLSKQPDILAKHCSADTAADCLQEYERYLHIQLFLRSERFGTCGSCS